ncbi:type II toxin-antitoxin system RnlB family antitoxin [Neobacillus sp. PS2-9]|uniref:type II toxin-antitoxin system RnlB family antitoxin n=1 Tax=Neobacillus sp. PS2-9 TaxID=3070676 RepID=UPI0027E07D9E|nr:type II toxin-antitoxin system RnlB family antitoxin [Neobacillus sp. PS2-9]WML58106.1 type II toxin-antitoxin system RnlB family antitoxin [Neobacillus sp. PS2-9]
MKKVSIEFLNDSSYSALLTTLSSESPIDLLRDFEEENSFVCSGKIIVDNILHSGNNSDRFIELLCENGKINYSSVNFIQIERKNDLRVKANNTLRQYPNIINNSILNNSQKKLLLHGISI